MRTFFASTPEGVVLKRNGRAMIYKAASPGAAAKKAFYTEMRTSADLFPVEPPPELKPLPPREDIVAHILKLSDDEALAGRFADRYLEAAAKCPEQSRAIHIVESGRARIWSYHVFRAPRWPVNIHQLQKGIYSGTISRKRR